MHTPTSHAPRTLGIFKLLMLAIVSVDSIRNLPIAAQYGTSLITLYLIAGIAFFVPLIFVIHHFATRYPSTGGSYIWIQNAFGEKWGFISIWLQWVYNIIWYPTIFAFISATLASMIAPGLETNQSFILFVSLACFWTITAINCFGVRMLGWMSSASAIVGTLLPMLLIIGLAIFWILSGHTSATPLTAAALIPNHTTFLHLTFFVNILFSLLGLDVIAMHGGDVKNPKRTYPRVLTWAGILIVSSLMFSALAICVVVPPEKIGLISGLMAAFQLFFEPYHLSWGLPFIGIAIILGSVGIAMSWMVGLARGLEVASHSSVSRLPKTLQKLNRYDMPYAVLILQGIVFTILMSVFLIFPDINSSYWLLSSMTAQFALLYYIILFCAAFKSFKKEKKTRRYLGWLCLGLLTSLVGILAGFLPPASIISAHAIWHYESLLFLGMLAFLTPLCFILKK